MRQARTAITRRSASAEDRRSKGFTMVELITVVAIIGVLAAFAVAAYSDYVNKAKKTVSIGTLETIRKTIELYHSERNVYPAGINSTTGLDPDGDVVFGPLLVTQVGQDLIWVSYQYNSAVNSYTLEARAKDKAQTLLTPTPSSLTY